MEAFPCLNSLLFVSCLDELKGTLLIVVFLVQVFREFKQLTHIESKATLLESWETWQKRIYRYAEEQAKTSTRAKAIYTTIIQ